MIRLQQLMGADRPRRHASIILAAAVAAIMQPGLAIGQTAIQPRTLGAANQAPPLPASPQIPVTAVPVPDSTVRQATQQANGNFTEMKRGAFGGQVQEAWDKAPPTAGTHQSELCDNCSYKVRLREFMVTVIELPRGEKISAYDNGDPQSFEVKQRGDNRLAVKPIGGYGIDSNLVVYGKSGNIYPLYLRAEGYNSKNVPDLRFVIEGAVRVDNAGALDDFPAGTAGKDSGHPAGGDKTSAAGANPALSLAAMAEARAAAGAASSTSAQPGTAGKGDFVASKPFDPDKLRGWGQYKLWGNGDDLKPETVFRDDYFTYVRFGDKFKSIELPTAYVVVDGIDEVVNTRVQGTTFVIESTQRLISLKSGKSYLCIQYGGQG
ncbi:TrbG/VirB9 family P-type conjugative transfer protein [Ferrovibrio xuzhouensis]|uniref:TrbG/VirB9 family P-type conjugative transfer protein n=1 Tax=Ferrovibrio xuzhouensis TaxID=1576914 RepID=A0ABV7VCN9_9PROT